MSDEELKPFNSIVQVCSTCGKIDVYKDDGHSCRAEALKRENLDYDN